VENLDADVAGTCAKVASTPFHRITYTEAVELLLKDSASGAVLAARGAEFENPVEWGCDLASEHERYIAEVVFKKPTIVYNYPKDIKAFYMRLNDDNKTVAAMDVLVPRVVRPCLRPCASSCLP
jgi:asparaginyl-tRNA synthetase